MKRYEPRLSGCMCCTGEIELKIDESPDGEWVRHEDAKRELDYAHGLLRWSLGLFEAALTCDEMNDDEQDTLDGLDKYEEICALVGVDPNPDIVAMRPGVELALDSYGSKAILRKVKP